ncbi:MAG: hypothetical protein INH37_16095 [Myxococcaceae bacterium]|jgi:hypothetical protein|nr:hypothetical protein [Myxococcaceae bacterium]
MYAAVASGACLAVGALAGVAGAALPVARFSAESRPDPLAVAGGLVIGFAVNVTALHLLLPEVAAWLRGTGPAGGAAARAEAFRFSRWPALGALAGLATFFVGAALERQDFGAGQGAMLAGAGLFAVGALSWDALEVIGAWQGVTAAPAKAP